MTITISERFLIAFSFNERTHYSYHDLRVLDLLDPSASLKSLLSPSDDVCGLVLWSYQYVEGPRRRATYTAGRALAPTVAGGAAAAA